MIVVDGLQVSKWDRDYIEELKKGGVTAVNVSRVVWENARETLSYIGNWYAFIREHRDDLFLVRKGEDILYAKDNGKIGVILGAQNASPLEDELGLVEIFNNLGLKIMQLTYNNQNLIGSSCYEEHDNGLSRYGELVIKEMNRVGMVIDLSHVGERTSLDAIAVSSRPVAITHANPRWLFPLKKRNKSKEVLRKLRDSRGMLGLTLFPRLMNGTNTTIEEFCNLVTETVDFMGVEHVGIGTDLTLNLTDDDNKWVRMGRWTHDVKYSFGATTTDNMSFPSWPSWFQSPADFPNLAEAMLKKGFSEKDVRAIMGENWLNFFINGFKREEEL